MESGYLPGAFILTNLDLLTPTQLPCSAGPSGPALFLLKNAGQTTENPPAPAGGFSVGTVHRALGTEHCKSNILLQRHLGAGRFQVLFHLLGLFLFDRF